MPSLNHVSMWSAEKHSWIPITAEDAARLFSFSVAANKGKFRCELCGHFVSLSVGSINAPHFRHAAADENKECEERSLVCSHYYTKQEIVNRAGLPIRLIVNDSKTSFRFEIGLHCIPNNVLGQCSSRQIEIKSASGSVFIYSFDRLKEDTLTYLPIGDEPSEQYSIRADRVLSQYWPSKITAIRSTGSIFDAQTGHLKRMDTDVVTGKQYYILSKRSCLYYSLSPAVRVDKICEKVSANGRWYLFGVSADKMSHEAYQFFLQFGCRLTEQPARLHPIWPVTTRSSYSVKTNRDALLLYLSGGYLTCNAPEARKQEISTSNGNMVVRVKPDRFPQLVSSGRTSIINYLYVWNDPLLRTQTISQVDVRDGNGNLVQSGSNNALPVKKLLFVTSPFDGMILILKKGIVIEKKTLKASERVPIFDVAFGYEIQVTQGLDYVWSALFQRTQAIGNADDELYKTLCRFAGREVRITHKDGAMIAHLGDCPKVKQWFYDKIRIGHAPYEALKHLKKYISEQHNG